MAIIKKRVDQLQKGDVLVHDLESIPRYPEPGRYVVTGITQAPAQPSYHTIAIQPIDNTSNKPPILIGRMGCTEFDVEVPDAQPTMPAPAPASEHTPPAPASEHTPPAPATAPAAQQHIDEMAALLDQAVRWFTPGSAPIPTPALGEWCAQSRKLLEAVAPQAPTLDEALAQLQAVLDAKHPGDELVRVYQLLDRARRAGVMK